MNRKDLIERLHGKTGLTKVKLREVLDALQEAVVEDVQAGRSTGVPGIVRVESAWAPPKILRTPAGQKMMVDGRWQLRARPAAALSALAAARTPQLSRDPRHQAAWRFAETLIGDLVAYHPKLAPTAVPAGVQEEQLLSLLRASFGVHWERVVETYQRQVPAEVREARNHLGVVAMRWWGK